MRRRVYDEPVEVRLSDGEPIGFHWECRDYQVTAVLKRVALRRPRDNIDIELWHIRARWSGEAAEETCELRRDHDRWRIAAIWD